MTLKQKWSLGLVTKPPRSDSASASFKLDLFTILITRMKYKPHS